MTGYFAYVERELVHATRRDNRTRARRRGLLLAGATVALALGAVGVAAVVPQADREPTAATRLLGAAAARAQTVSQMGPREITVERASLVTSVDKGGAWSALIPSEQQLEVGDEGQVTVTDDPSNPVFLGAHDRAAWEAAGRPELAGTRTTRHFDAGEASDPQWGDLAKLPTDPKALLAVLRERAGASDDPTAEVLALSADLLAEPAAPGDLRSAVFEALERLDRLDIVGDATDHRGRRGVGIGLTSAHAGAKTRTELVFDPTTTRPLGIQTTLLEPVTWVDAKPGTAIDYSVYRYGGASAGPGG